MMRVFKIEEKVETGYGEMAIVTATDEDHAWKLVEARMLEVRRKYNISEINCTGFVYYHCV